MKAIILCIVSVIGLILSLLNLFCFNLLWLSTTLIVVMVLNAIGLILLLIKVNSQKERL